MLFKYTFFYISLVLVNLNVFSQQLPWDMEQLYKSPEWEKTTLAPAPGMTALLYKSLPFHEKPVQVFAYYSSPSGRAPTGGWPAVICVHGGGGTAFPKWVQKWNDHGFAAISMDLEGHIPLNRSDKNGRQSTPHPGPSRIGVFHDYEKDLKDQWYYHAMAQIIIAHSLVRSFPEINSEKIGITGISWGGNLTSSVMGVDTRFKFAIPAYGCGFLSASSGHQGRAISDGKHTTIVNKYYDGSAYYANVKYPTLWINGTNDFHFDMPAFQKSANSVQGQLRFQLEMDHGHGSVWNLPEPYAFANSVVNEKPGLISFQRPQAEDNKAWVNFTAPKGIQSAQILYTLDPNPIWPDKKWFSAPASIASNHLSATLPAGTQAFLFTANDKRQLMSSSNFIEHRVAGNELVKIGSEFDFSQAYSAAIQPQAGKKIYLADNFENGLSAPLSKSFNINDPSGVAGIQEWYDKKASGAKSLRIKNSISVEHGFMPLLSQWFRGHSSISQGSLKLNCDLLIPTEGGNPIAIQVRDYHVKPAENMLNLSLNSKSISLANQSIQIKADQWFHLELSIPVNSTEEKITLKVSQKGCDEQLIELPSLKALKPSWLGIMLSGKQTAEVFMDNIVISHHQ